jgi:putative two-component system response regulator
MGSLQTEKFEALLNAKSSAEKAELKVVLTRLAAELCARGRNSSRASLDYFNSAFKALNRFRGLTHAELRIQCLFDCAAYFYNQGIQPKALEAALCAVHLASLSGNLAWMRKACTYSAVMHADVGNLSDALGDYARALELCNQLNDHLAKARVLMNAGVALNYAGLYEEAIPCFERAAAATAPPQGDVEIYYSALTNHAQSLLYLERYREGFQIAHRAITGTPEPRSNSEIVSCAVKEGTFVQLSLELGNVKVAREHSKKCLAYAHMIDSSRVRQVADVAVGLCEVHGGDVAKGLELLEQAVRRSTAGDSAWFAASRALVKAYDVAGDPVRALHHMKALLDYLRSQRNKTLAVLLSLGSDVQSSVSRDLQALELREARLETRVAEAQAVAQTSEMFERLAVTADLKEEASGLHGYRVGKLSSLVARSIGWNSDLAREVEVAARLHDIGKIAMPDRILLTSKELQAAERHFMSTHTSIGAELLGKSNIPQLRMAEEIARHHHEWWNGDGYPSKLKGKRIPIHARIVALADVFDALTHGRPFSPPWSIDKALDEIRARRGTQFDPELTDLFLDLIDRLRNEHEDLDEYLGSAGKNSPFLQARSRIRQMLAQEREQERMATVAGNETRH